MLQYGLRHGDASDLQAMFRLDCLCFEPPFRFTRRAMAYYATKEGAFTLIAESLGGLLGFLIVQIDTTDAAAYLVTLDVDPDVRRQGVASRLMEAAEVLAAERSASTLSLHVWEGNAAAILFYLRRGYSEAGRERHYYGPEKNALVLTRELGAAV